MWEGSGDGTEVPHLVIHCLIVGGGLIDEPDFDGIIDNLVLVIGDADGDGCGLIDGEVSWVSFCFASWSQEVEFGECFSGFWHGDDINKRRDNDEDGDDKNNSEGTIDFVFLFR